MGKNPIERLHAQFYKYYLGLNRRAPNIVSRNEVGRLSLKSNIYAGILKFWIHLENLPESSIAKQCLQISKQLAENKKQSFISAIIEILKFSDSIDHSIQTVNLNTIFNIHDSEAKNQLNKIKQKITNALQIHQADMITSNRKLVFYSSFKTDQSKSIQLDLIKNTRHRQSLAKLRSGNHNLRIETGRHCLPKIPENLRICQYCESRDIENETHFLLECTFNKSKREKLHNDITLKYPCYINLNKKNKILFLFNNIDPFICKKLAHFIYETFQTRKH